MISFIAALEKKNKDKMDFKGKHVNKILFQIVISMKIDCIAAKTTLFLLLTNHIYMYIKSHFN